MASLIAVVRRSGAMLVCLSLCTLVVWPGAVLAQTFSISGTVTAGGAA